jgi:hypothetical protein
MIARTLAILAIVVEVSVTKGNGVQNFHLRDQDLVNGQFESSTSDGHLECFFCGRDWSLSYLTQAGGA